MTPAAPAGSSQPSRRVQAGNRGPPTDAAHRQPCETAMVMLLAADFKSALSALIGAIFQWLQIKTPAIKIKSRTSQHIPHAKHATKNLHANIVRTICKSR